MPGFVLWDVASGQEISTLQAHSEWGFFRGFFAGWDHSGQWEFGPHGSVVGYVALHHDPTGVYPRFDAPDPHRSGSHRSWATPSKA